MDLLCCASQEPYQAHELPARSGGPGEKFLNLSPTGVQTFEGGSELASFKSKW